ncbi:hypothetical protein DPMN_186905 [Dreissena polymorpha]|uniref:Uncharacterized protein n=1 Tax=Dreissena polymorpha TaxID=45954 RepID=A0A9D4I8K3_DREPO|nr:hypothetical protein DPMN_186905 [Dreissena polymorpha]
MKLAVEQWFMEQSQGRTGTKSDGKSVRISVKTDVSSHLSIERVKEDQRMAEVLARQEAFKQKRTIAEETLRLKLKEEELEIQTEINVSDAKSRILADLEKSILEDSAFETKPQIPDVSTIKIDKTQESFGISVARELSKPRAEINKFSGSASEYIRFKRQF